MPPRSELRLEIATAAKTLADAGIDTAQVDAELLAAHIVGVERGRLGLVELPDGFSARYRELVAGRSRRVPLQHLTGLAPFGPLMLHVGPGVFVPRPETESLLGWALKAVENRSNPLSSNWWRPT